MHHPFTPAFAEEAARYELRFNCEDCGNFDARSERCRHEWPVELHRRPAAREPGTGEVVFCKEFELA